ncbi:hypothetical protein Moror_9918 [Moniliophthora roreri MCA 2997]|uniref:Uncharacterized protein n=1 Tax=Moniliophthora roreri (strain MCA 2997) TaxID=1381753 RepID=V2WYV7_MONRO|nr:hypothetical protein Moror_9918 [Moniliophthora roreri MCA 2997]
MSTPAAPGVTQEEQATLYNFGQRVVWNTVGGFVESVFWAIYVVLFMFAMRIQLKRGVRSLTSIILLLVSIFLFASSTALWAMYVVDLLTQFRIFFLKYPELRLADRVAQVDIGLEKFGLPEESLFLLNMIVGDGVVIWRAWVLCGHSRLQKLVYIPIVMVMAAFAFVVIALDCLGNNGFVSQSTESSGSKTCQWGEPIAWGISLMTNITSTSIIAARAWGHHCFVCKTFGSKRRRSQAENVLLILVDSGFIYCLFWLSQLILFFPVAFGTPAQRMYSILSGMGEQISGLYPTLIIILVNMQRSMSDSPDLLSSAKFKSGNNGIISSDQFQTQLSTETTTSGTDSDKVELSLPRNPVEMNRLSAVHV